MKNRTIIAIVGIPGSGKTSLANKLSSELAGIPVLNTDIVKAAYEDENPQILSKVSHNAWELMGSYSELNVKEGYTLFSKTLFRYTYSLAKKLLNTYTTVIIEGMGIDIPALSDIEEDVICIFLTNDNIEKSYLDKLKYRVNKINNWEIRKDILKIIEKKLYENYRIIVISKHFDIHQDQNAIDFVKFHLGKE